MTMKGVLLVVFCISTSYTVESLNMMDAYNSVVKYSEVLHETLQEAAREVSKFDPDAAQAISLFEYNWLSLIGIYKGIFPVVADFFMSYYNQKDFVFVSRKLSDAFIGVYQAFSTKRDTGIIYLRVKELLELALKSDAFKDGAIRSLLQDLNELASNDRSFRVILGRLKEKQGDVEELLYFIITGRINEQAPAKTEL